ncbi:MAG: hypothetical protein JWQ71_4211 [Pedosphaera sp.]|nr:hypothetical protein [Pedosphaera sp.]
MKAFASLLVLVGGINLFSFIIFSMVMGGHAGNGKIEDGRYYLGNHSRYTEVSASVFQYSLWQSHCLWITQPLLFVGAYLRVAYEKKEQRRKRKLV